MHRDNQKLDGGMNAIRLQEYIPGYTVYFWRFVIAHFVATNLIAMIALGSGIPALQWLTGALMTPLGWIGVLLIRLSDRSMPVNVLTSFTEICLWLVALWLNSLAWTLGYRRAVRWWLRRLDQREDRMDEKTRGF